MKIVLYIDVFVKQVIYSSTKSIKSVMYTKSDFTNFISYVENKSKLMYCTIIWKIITVTYYPDP
jgi:hypothetical protein